MRPMRVQLSRKKGWRKPENTVVVSRPSDWGNIYTVALARKFHPDESDAQLRARCVAAFRASLDEADKRIIRRELAGKNLACWCPIFECHDCDFTYGYEFDKRPHCPKCKAYMIRVSCHADIPLERTGGRELARALIAKPCCAVIDLSLESKKFWHTFLTDFCLELMQLTPLVATQLFVEESPEFLPQRTSFELTARCKEAVERVIRLGRNQGYGMTLVTQRPATVDKDALSQCENLFIMRTVGPHDRKALVEWADEKQDIDEKQKEWIDWSELPKAESGEAIFWSPHWTGELAWMKFRERLTFHPGATRTADRQAAQDVKLCDVSDLVGAISATLKAVQSKAGEKVVTRPPLKVTGALVEHKVKDDPELREALRECAELRLRVSELEQSLAKERTAKMSMMSKLSIVQRALKPQFEAYQKLFGDDESETATGGIDRAPYEAWLAKARRRGCGRMLEALLERPQLTKNQLGTLSNVASTKSTFRAYLAWLKQNGLVEVDGDTVRLRTV